MDAVIKLTNLTKQYGDYKAVNDLNLTINKGEVFGLLGPNGAGKTTTILMLLGLTERTEGEIEVLGLDPQYNALEVKSKVGYMPDDIGFYDDRTAIENLVYTAMLNGMTRQSAIPLAEQLLQKVGLSAATNKKVSAFSRGMRQRLGLADVLIKQPHIIILDEPTLGIDPEGVRELLELITRLSKEEGITVLLSSHHLQQVQKVCDRVGLFVKGKLLAYGQIDELAQQLNEQEEIKVQLQIKHAQEQFKTNLEQISYISSFEIERLDVENSEIYTLYCNEDKTSELAKLATEHGELMMLQRHRYGLDDIYHRYFSGGDADDSLKMA